MKRIFTLTILPIILLNACSERTAVTEKHMPIETEKNEVNFWEGIKGNFPYKGITDFDFSTSGQPLNMISNLPLIDTSLFNNLTKQIQTYSQWKEHLEIFYFSLNEIDNKEVGIFLTKREFDGTNYTFDLIQFDKNSKVTTFKNIANNWEAAECIGYSRAKINTESNILAIQKLQKCYDEETEKIEVIDSIIIKLSLGNLELKLIEKDTLN